MNNYNVWMVPNVLYSNYYMINYSFEHKSNNKNVHKQQMQTHSKTQSKAHTAQEQTNFKQCIKHKQLNKKRMSSRLPLFLPGSTAWKSRNVHKCIKTCFMLTVCTVSNCFNLLTWLTSDWMVIYLKKKNQKIDGCGES